MVVDPRYYYKYTVIKFGSDLIKVKKILFYKTAYCFII